MHPPAESPIDPGRRRSLAVLVNSLVAATGGALGTLLGIFAVRPGAAAAPDRWVRAAALDDLAPGVPVACVVAVARADGWYRSRARETVFLVWDGAREVKAFSATCTHLGCQVHWDGSARQFRCPCHGGAYAMDGAVVEGPPPRPLDTVAARVEDAGRLVLVRL
jgi:Rieske Fe-S protein